MKSIGDPSYEYRPLSDELRSLLSQKQRERLGILEGYRIVYGQLFTETLAEVLRPMLSFVAKKQGRSMAEDWAKRLSFLSEEEAGACGEHLNRQRKMSRTVRGFFATLTSKQQEAALAHHGPENFGDEKLAR